MIINNRGSSFIRACCVSRMRHKILQIPRKKEDIVDIVFAARNMASSCDKSEMVVPKEEVVRFIQQCMCKVGTLKEDAYIVAYHLMTSDYRGHFSHGMNRLQMYVKDIQNKNIDPLAKPCIVKDFKVRKNFYYEIMEFLLLKLSNVIVVVFLLRLFFLLFHSLFVSVYFFPKNNIYVLYIRIFSFYRTI